MFKTHQYAADSSYSQTPNDDSYLRHLSKLVNVCGHCGKKYSDKGLNEAVASVLCGFMLLVKV